MCVEIQQQRGIPLKKTKKEIKNKKITSWFCNDETCFVVCVTLQSHIRLLCKWPIFVLALKGNY